MLQHLWPCPVNARSYMYTTQEVRQTVQAKVLTDDLVSRPSSNASAGAAEPQPAGRYLLAGAPLELHVLGRKEWSISEDVPGLRDARLYHGGWSPQYRLMVRAPGPRLKHVHALAPTRLEVLGDHILVVEAACCIESLYMAPTMVWLRQRGTRCLWLLQGDWRLAHMPAALRASGHQYVLQIDDDSYIMGKIGKFCDVHVCHTGLLRLGILSKHECSGIAHPHTCSANVGRDSVKGYLPVGPSRATSDIPHEYTYG